MDGEPIDCQQTRLQKLKTAFGDDIGFPRIVERPTPADVVQMRNRGVDFKTI